MQGDRIARKCILGKCLVWLRVTCERGFEETGDLCTVIAVSANAYLNGSGYAPPWTCERGFFERDGLCAAVVIPANAYLTPQLTKQGGSVNADKSPLATHAN